MAVISRAEYRRRLLESIINEIRERGRMSVEEVVEMTGYATTTVKYSLSKDLEVHSDGCVKLVKVDKDYFFEWRCSE